LSKTSYIPEIRRKNVLETVIFLENIGQINKDIYNTHKNALKAKVLTQD